MMILDRKNQCTCSLCNQEFTPADGMTTTEHLAHGILKAYSEMQDNGDPLPCPRCGECSMSKNVLHDALSRHFGIHICHSCGKWEAVATTNDHNQSLESWWVISAILGQQ
jgi:hypothetical protein